MDDVILPLRSMYAYPERRYPFLEKIFALCRKRNRKTIKLTPKGQYNWEVYYSDAKTGKNSTYVRTVTYNVAMRTIYALRNSKSVNSDIELHIRRTRRVRT